MARQAPTAPGRRRRLMYGTGTVAGVLGLGVALIASPAVARMTDGDTAEKTSESSAETAGNLALNQPATGSAACRPDETADKAVNGSLDGGLADKWCSGARGAKLTIDLGDAFDLASVTVDHAQAGGEDARMNTRAYDILVSADGKRFRTAARVRGNAEAETTTPVERSARYVRIRVRAGEQGRGGAARIYEVSVAGAENAAEPAPSATTTAEPTPSTEPTPSETTTTEPTTKPTAEPTASTPSPVGCHDDAPAKLTDYVAEHTTPMTRISCNADVAVYYDDNLKALPAADTAWVTPLATDIWAYFKKVYGSCAADRQPAAEIGGCEQFGAAKPALWFMHKDSYSGGTVNSRFDADSGFRTTNDVGYGNWSGNDPQLRDIMVHEACHQVEGAGQGTQGSPAFGLWGDSKWAEFCVYDFYAGTGRTADAARTQKIFSAGHDNLPSGAKDAAWFKDWFLPLHQEGKGAAVMQSYFELLAQHFPTRQANGGKNLAYARDLNIGEYVLFTSAAAGKDLSGRAAQAFNSGFSQAQFEQAKKDFPELKF